MRKQLLLTIIFAFIFAAFGFSQRTSNLIVFSENGERFILSIDGKVYNNSPESNVKATGLTGDFHQVSIQFEDKSLGMANQNIALEPGLEQKAVVKLKKKGGYAIRPFGEPVALSESAPIPVTPAPTSPSRIESESVTDAPDAPSQTTVTTTTTTTASGDSESFKVDVGAGDTKMAIDISIPAGMGTVGSSTTVQTVETTTMSSASQTKMRSEDYTTDHTEEVVSDCAAMAGGDFSAAVKAISSNSFEDSKLTTAKQVLKGNCLDSDQIVKVMQLFTYEESKLEFAKAAHERCTDRQNYWKMNDAFTFESSIDELNEFLETK